MPDSWSSFLEAASRDEAVLVTVVATEGSAPRDVGAWMAVFATHTLGTIGGGHVEFEAIACARVFLCDASVQASFTKRYVLGPSLGQCCGGVMHICYEKYSKLSNKYAGYWQKLPLKQQNIALFGGGHVGKAIVRILATLPMQVHWIDSRDEIFPAELPANVRSEHSDPVQAAVKDIASNSQVLIMSFSHAEDLDIVAACLLRQRQQNDLPYIGLIGSKTKWASFRHRLAERGFSATELSHVTCPIGVAGITGKEPQVIAVSVAAQLLQYMQHEL